MAEHLGSGQHKAKKSTAESSKVPPRLFQWHAPKKRKYRYAREFSKTEMLPVAAAVVLCVAALLAPVGTLLKTIAYAITALVAGFSLIRRAVLALLRKHWPDEDFLPIPAAALCFLAGRPALGAVLVILSRASEFVQAYVMKRGERGVQALGESLPEKAHLEESFGLLEVIPEELKMGDVILVYPGEAVPVDAVVLAGEGPVDSSRFGGPEDPVAVKAGEEVLSGTVNIGETMRFKVLRRFEDSGLSKHLQSLSGAARKKTRLEQTEERVCSFVTPALILLALIIGIVVPLFNGKWSSSLVRAALILFLASPAALLLSIPLAYLGGMTCASHSGMRIKTKPILYRLARVKTVVFGKTGTITDGNYTVTEVVALKGSQSELLRIAAEAESDSRHPIAVAIKEAAGAAAVGDEAGWKIEEIPGRGVSALLEGKQVYVGNASLLEEHGIWYRVPDRPGAAVHVAVDGVYWGHILLSDKIREGAFDAVEELRSQGVRNVVMLTGDVRSVTSKLARSLNFDMVKTDLSASEKISSVDYLRKSLGKGERLACVGDGFHDAAMFKKADVGIALNAMGDSSAEKSADVILMDNELERIPEVIKIAKETDWLIKENTVALGVGRALLLALSFTGLISVVTALVLSTAVDCAVSVNALRSFTVD